jgi:D-alanyl-D-alanine carboxypeptidase/D-alanyl-D-alanine-endopeptidase (penicillin-binding protein 4)
MVARERRGKAAPAALILVLGVVLAAVFLPRPELSASDASAGPDGGRPAAGDDGAGPAAPERARAKAPRLTLSLDPVLEADVRAIIREARDCVVERGKGRFAASEVTVAVHARDLATGAVSLAVDDTRAMRPASCMKLVTTAAALALLGAEWQFETGFDAGGPVESGVLAGDLVVRAAGDPLYAGTTAGVVEARLDEVASALVGRGVRRVAGDLVLDLGTFADAAPGPEWPDPSQYWQGYCALATGLTANGGVLFARVRPTDVGQRARIEVWPAAHGLGTRYTTETIAQAVNDVRVGATTSTVTVAGSIGRGIEVVEADFAHPDPVLLFESALRAALGRAGIQVDGGTRRVRHAPAGARLYTLRSPLAGTLVPINTHSINAVADQVFLSTGGAVQGAATREGGRAATARALEALDVPADGLVQVDGSGLSRANRVSARQLSALLAAVLAQDSGVAEAYLDSLAVAGESGTLEKRMTAGPAQGRVFAKSGWISGTSSLSGLVRSVDGREHVFAILVEYPAAASGMNTHCFKPMHDAIVERIVRGKAR